MMRIKAYITVGNPKGVHGRVATRLAEITRDNNLEITLSCSGEEADANSILDVLSLALAYGSFVNVIVKGDNAVSCLPLIYTLLVSDDSAL